MHHARPHKLFQTLDAPPSRVQPGSRNDAGLGQIQLRAHLHRQQLEGRDSGHLEGSDLAVEAAKILSDVVRAG
jgi:hypothetical protein